MKLSNKHDLEQIEQDEINEYQSPVNDGDNFRPDWSKPFLAPYLSEAWDKLESYGVTVDGSGYLSVTEAAGNILIAEAVNLAAKELNPEFYELKAHVFVEAAESGKEYGVSVYFNDQDGTWSLYHKDVGVVSFHDPNNNITRLIKEADLYFSKPYGWSGLYRQDQAFELLNDAELLQKVSQDTSPEFVIKHHIHDLNIQESHNYPMPTEEMFPKNEPLPYTKMDEPAMVNYGGALSEQELGMKR